MPVAFTIPALYVQTPADYNVLQCTCPGLRGDELMSTVQTDYTQVLQKVRTWPTELQQNLAGEIMEALAADSSLPLEEWNETRNARRCELIDKEIDGTLTPAERVELDLLQKQAVARQMPSGPYELWRGA
jgi:hypothetical protein